MFFTPELLAKRDSGFGLLWLAATLGSRSAFKKLPKRTVLTADIGQLCELISEPAEPLALRLSSNLMFGVVRVYKVKQEILLTDVTNCVALLKKVIQDMHTSGASDGQLQMQNPMARPATLTIVANPRAAYELDFDAFVADWDEYLNVEGEASRGSDAIEDGDEDFDPTNKKKKVSAKPATRTEVVRKEAHTLEEHHEHLLSASFDLSLSFEKLAHGDVSSSQAAADFEDFFAFSDGLDLGDGLADGLGDDLARELGWAASPVKSASSARKSKSVRASSTMNFDDHAQGMNFDMDFNFNLDGPDMAMYADQPMDEARERENTPLPQSEMPHSERQAQSPAVSFSRALLSQDEQPLLNDIMDEVDKHTNRSGSKKLKRTRLLLDARTELTDDELKAARAMYLQSQLRIKREMFAKQQEKDNGKVIEDLIWGVPNGIQAQGLVRFWQQNFKVQVEARSRTIRLHRDEDEPPSKRRKSSNKTSEKVDHHDAPMDLGNWDMDWLAPGNNNDMDMAMAIDGTGGSHRQSSEEPGQARHISRSASVLGSNNFGFDIGPRDAANGSQRSSLFPWDNAGPSSSVGNDAFPAVDNEQVVVAAVDTRLRSSSLSHRETPGQRGSLPPPAAMTSPAAVGRNLQLFGEDFIFEVDNTFIREETQGDTQKSDLNLITLERNSFNFLEYAKMQHHTLPTNKRLTFDVVVPQTTSTCHVAAAAFYHCLVLATKNLLHLEQGKPYEAVIIGIL